MASLCNDSSSSVVNSGVIIRLLKSSKRIKDLGCSYYSVASTINATPRNIICSQVKEITHQQRDRIVADLMHFLLSGISWKQTAKIGFSRWLTNPFVMPITINYYDGSVLDTKSSPPGCFLSRVREEYFLVHYISYRLRWSVMTDNKVIEKIYVMATSFVECLARFWTETQFNQEVNNVWIVQYI